MTRNWPTLTAAIMTGLLFAALPPRLLADPPTTAPATQPDVSPATQPAARSFSQIMADFSSTSAGLRDVLKPATINDAKAREAAAPQAIAILKKMRALTDEMESDPRGKQLAAQLRPQLVSLLAIFGDPETTSALQTTAKGTDAAAIDAQSTLLLAQWVAASKDTPAQTKVLEQAEALSKGHPTELSLVRLYMGMSQRGDAPKDLRNRAMDDAVAMDTPMSKRLAEQVAAEKKIQAVENQPLVIEGTTVEGKPFTTADWKGKVVLVDFWATWCGPCRAELPRVKKAYTDFHDKGLEILGVSNDFDSDALVKFTTADATMPWPQLFDKSAASEHNWNPTTLGFGIHGIPTMFLIDKKGICRSVTARENFEEMIPKLLAE